jgi:hypothetical protein
MTPLFFLIGLAGCNTHLTSLRRRSYDLLQETQRNRFLPAVSGITSSPHSHFKVVALPMPDKFIPVCQDMQVAGRMGF